MIIIKRIKPYIIIILGASILSFGIYNIHGPSGITEGGELGIELLFLNWFNISPSITSVVMDIIFYGLGAAVLGLSFIKYAAAATAAYSASYFLWSSFPPLLPNFSSQPLLAALLGALFVGMGCGLVVRVGGACSGDDALALSMSKILNTKIEYCYWISDFTILLLSLSYLPLSKILWSLLSVTLSSWLVGFVQRFGKTAN